MKNVTTAVHRLPVPRCDRTGQWWAMPTLPVESDRRWERDNRYAPAILAEGPVVTGYLGREEDHQQIPSTSNILSIAAGDLWVRSMLLRGLQGCTLFFYFNIFPNW